MIKGLDTRNVEDDDSEGSDMSGLDLSGVTDDSGGSSSGSSNRGGKRRNVIVSTKYGSHIYGPDTECDVCGINAQVLYAEIGHTSVKRADARCTKHKDSELEECVFEGTDVQVHKFRR